MRQIRYLGTSCFEMTAASGRRLVVDPHLDENEHAAIRSEELGAVDLVLVTHGGFDHLGDAFAITRRTGAMLFTSADVAIAATLDGVPEEQVFPMVSGARREHAGFAVQAVEARHLSLTKLADGYISGQPLGFVIRDAEAADGEVIYHGGDTSLFSDMKLIAELYEPTVGLIGLGGLPHLPHEMDPPEAARAAEWLGIRRAVPMHLVPGCGDGEAFAEEVARRTPGIRVDVLLPGETLDLRLNHEPAA
jgi:L-ascorbate metabolism protein UlaG (beta-lactamase superfamily)